MDTIYKSSAIYKWMGCIAFAGIAWAHGAATAYDSTVGNNLARSRDALLRQRDHLREAADHVSEKIDVLQRQLDTINSYMRDTDNALRDVETAMSRGY